MNPREIRRICKARNARLQADQRARSKGRITSLIGMLGDAPPDLIEAIKRIETTKRK